jgi:hypothetical protein
MSHAGAEAHFPRDLAPGHDGDAPPLGGRIHGQNAQSVLPFLYAD